MKKFFKPLCIGILILWITQSQAQTFQVDDIVIGDTYVHYLDPEFIDVNGQYMVMFYVPVGGFNSMWVADLNPTSGELVSPNGLDLFIDDSLPSIFTTLINGAEWGADINGQTIFYTKADINGKKQVWRAQLGNPPVLSKLTNDSIDNIHWAATLNPDDNSTFFFLARVNTNGTKTLYYTDANNVSYNHPLLGFDWSTNGSRFIPDTALFVFPKQISSNKFELAEVNMSNGIERIITNDNVRKMDVWGFKAPEYGNEILYTALISNVTIGIYRFLHPYDPFATLIDSIKAPQGHPLKYLRSIEILQTGEGCFDKTYFAFLGSKNPVALTPSDGAMWVASLGSDTGGRFVRRVDIGAVTGDSSYRVEPELLIGNDEVFLYYNAYNFDNSLEFRRCRTGIFKNTNSVIQNPNKDIPDITIFPNPTHKQLSISNLPSSFKGWVSIYNTMGQLIQSEEKSGSQFSIQTGHLMTGFYFLHIKTEEGTTITNKIIRQ